MSGRQIQVVPYDPQWVVTFAQEQQRLLACIGSNALRIDHIGSTSVPGLIAKPVIDMLVEVTDLDALDQSTPALQALGYEARGEYGIPGRRYFCKGGAQRTHHLHAYARGDNHLLRHRRFRDYLIAHPKVMAEYAQVKHAAVLQSNGRSSLYQALKEDFIARHEALSLAWHGS
ncbi:GrpB family protein [Aestuariibacter halophilus]|uniref:GrpB family protein n=1 Tax=Fluctibacter halophilus TaxID=226011 RepID=A0ABS8G9Z7_9ALTE|nr:GrpB family protein [Aestuariibacter halophilus]MCC2617323.1 GrpB family protein [Aestuariibacter halophilus]